MRCKKIVASVLLFVLLSPSGLFAQVVSEVFSSVDRIRQIVQELETISQERENYLRELENLNNENRSELKLREAELLLRIAELNERENELKELRLQLELFGSLIDDQALYSRNSQRKLKFWRIFSGVLGASLATSLIIWGVSR